MVRDKKKALAQKANTLKMIQEEYTPILNELQAGSQNHQILCHLMKRGSITNVDAAREYVCYRLAARIKNLRDRGVLIETILKPTADGTSRYAEYEIRAK